MGIVLLLLGGLVGAVVVIALWTMWWITHPPRRTFASAISKGRPADPSYLDPGPLGARAWSESVVRLCDVDVALWSVQGDVPDGPCLILSHGWGDSRVGALSRCQALLPVCSRIIMWEMPGHGTTPGNCTLGTREVAMLRALMAHVSADDSDMAPSLVLMGWSLGAGVSIAAASRWESDAARHLLAVIAEAPYRVPWTPAENVLRLNGLPWRINVPIVMAMLGIRFGVGPHWQGGGKFDRLEHAKALRVPLLVIHGSHDDVSPIVDGRKIAAIAPQGHLVELESAGHHGIWTTPTSRDLCVAAVRELLKTTSTSMANVVRPPVR
jgi:uncharacterized protein